MYPCDSITLFYAKHRKKVETSAIFWLTFFKIDLASRL